MNIQDIYKQQMNNMETLTTLTTLTTPKLTPNSLKKYLQKHYVTLLLTKHIHIYMILNIYPMKILYYMDVLLVLVQHAI